MSLKTLFLATNKKNEPLEARNPECKTETDIQYSFLKCYVVKFDKRVSY